MGEPIPQEQYQALIAHTSQLEQRLHHAQVQAERAVSLEFACSQLQQRCSEAESRNQQLEGERQRLQATAEAEAQARQQTASLLEAAEAQRTHLQLARDELATQLLVAERRAAEAEEEQERAELNSQAASVELKAAMQGIVPLTPPAAPVSSPQVAELERQLLQERERSQALAQALQSERAAPSLRPSGASQADLPRTFGPSGPRSVASVDGSLASYADADASSPRGDASATHKLAQRVARLKASRDKLLGEVDVQSAELDRLHIANSALEQAVHSAKESSQAWEAQLQDALQRIEQLKGLLAEGIAWHTGESEAEHAQDANKRLEASLMEQKVREITLQLQVAALCAELTRAADVTGDLSRSVLPALTGIEGQLTHILQSSSGAAIDTATRQVVSVHS